MSIDLNKLDSMLDDALNQETTETLNEWIEEKEAEQVFISTSHDNIIKFITNNQK